MSGHLFDTDTQVTAINAVLREQGQTIAVLTNAVPAIQEGIADLRTSIQNDVNTRLRASEQTFDTALAAYRRETTTALTNHTTEQRRTIRELTGQMTELLRLPNPYVVTQQLRAEIDQLLDGQREDQRIASQLTTDRIERLERETQTRLDQMAAALGRAQPRETGARPRTASPVRPAPEAQAAGGRPQRGDSPPPSYTSATRPGGDRAQNPPPANVPRARAFTPPPQYGARPRGRVSPQRGDERRQPPPYEKGRQTRLRERISDGPDCR